MEVPPEEGGCFELFARLIFSLVLLVGTVLVLLG
jgi:hypothetical protein